MCAVPSPPGVAGVRVGRLCLRNGGHEWGDRRRRALMLAILAAANSRANIAAARRYVEEGDSWLGTT